MPARIVVGEIAEILGPGAAGRSWGPADRAWPWVEPVHRRAELEDLAAGEVGIEDRFVRQEADQPLDRDAVLEGIQPVDEQPPLRRFEDAHEEAEQGGLAGAVGAEQPADLAGRDGEGDVLERQLLAEGLGDALDLDEMAGPERISMSTVMRPVVILRVWRPIQEDHLR